jgi:cytochrome c oxidase subunit II
VIAIARRRHVHDDTTLAQGEAGALRWIYIGTGISTVCLIVALAYTLVTLNAVAAPPHEPALTLTVTAYDWWWKVDYEGAREIPAFSTANEIHIPVGEPVKIVLKSADVIHAFWVPQLAGKTQTIPGQINEQWIQADAPGVYRGQCSQFCGAQHAHMAFEVVAQDHAAFDAWRREQAQPATTVKLANDALASRGEQLFQSRCAGCHAVRGTDSNGAQAPDLTHLDSRRLIAAGALTNTPEHQLDWIRHAQQIKPDSLMPSMVLTANEAAAVSAYLATLH